ncbi:MAG: hypothetical protein FWE62_06675, partial [Firmicutes bacterium]|nr:hypothetical protein [Bacillota bacterium]
SFDYLGGRDVMPIGGWHGPHTPWHDDYPYADFINERTYDLIKRSGINFISASPDDFDRNPESLERVIDLAHRCGIGIFPTDRYLIRNENLPRFKERLAGFIDRPNVLGLHITDEPYGDRFPELARVVDAFNAASGKTAYINMLPNYGGGITRDNFYPDRKAPYDEFLDDFLTQVKVKMLSYDFYPFSYEKPGDVFSQSWYFDNLASACAVSKKHGLPFWVFIQCGSEWNDHNKELEILPADYPGEYALMWNVNTCLAYGAKAVQYFTVLQPVYYATSEGGQKYFGRNGMIGADGSTNRWYYYVMRANAQIAAVDHVLMNASNEGVILNGRQAKNNVLGAEVIQSGAYGPLKRVDGGSLLTGCFDYAGKSAFYIVNFSVSEWQWARLYLDGRRNIEIIQKTASRHIKSDEASLYLEPGEGVLAVVE